MATEPKQQAAAGKSAPRAKKSASTVDLKPLETRLAAIESELGAAERRLTERLADLDVRINAVETRGDAVPPMRMPAGFANTVRQTIDRTAELIRRNPITALILIVAFLLVALFS